MRTLLTLLTNTILAACFCLMLTATNAQATVWTVAKTADTNNGACNADCSLREAIAAAVSGDTIQFSALFDQPQTITLADEFGQLFINSKNLTITGKGAQLLTVRRAPTATTRFRIFEIRFSTITISGMTISGGYIERVNNVTNGGGIWTNNTATVTNSTIADNESNFSGSASGFFRSGSLGAVTIRSTIIAANRSNATVPDVSSPTNAIISQGYNLIGNNGSVTAFNQTGDQIDDDEEPLDPRIVALALNGGTTLTHALLQGSPAIDKGNSFGLAVDQRGLIRPVDLANLPAATGGDNSDIGAFEAQTIPAAAGIEADVSPRGNGNGAVSSTDVSTIQGFQLGLGLPYQGNEFQRADCAPFSSRGDGRVSSIDVSQAQAYQLGFNLTDGGTLQPAAGPTVPSGGSTQFEIDESPNSEKSNHSTDGVQIPREVRVVNTSGSGGQTVVVPIEVDAAGDESVYGFTLSYNSTRLTNPVVISGTTGGSVSANTTQTGKIGVSVSFGGGTIAAGSNQRLVNVQFTVVANATAGTTPLSFTDQPTFREVASAAGGVGGVQVLPTTFTDGQLSVTGSTAMVSVSGRVITGQGRGIRNVIVTLTDSSGNARTATTAGFGYYRFIEVATGETYTIGVKARHYNFSQPTQLLTINEEAANINFIGSGSRESVLNP